MRKIPVLFLLLLATTLVTASEPGQPLDCSDWVVLESDPTAAGTLGPPLANNGKPAVQLTHLSNSEEDSPYLVTGSDHDVIRGVAEWHLYFSVVSGIT